MALTYYLSMFISTIIENNNGGIQKLGPRGSFDENLEYIFLPIPESIV